MTITQEQADAIYLEAIGIENDKNRINHIVKVVAERNRLRVDIEKLREQVEHLQHGTG
jgi:predicted nucleotidyltransferase